MSQRQHTETRYARRYERWALPFRGRPRAVRALGVANRLIVWLFYGAYGALLVLVALGAPLDGVASAESGAGDVEGLALWSATPIAARLAAMAALTFVPGAAFALLSAVRARLNAPRPYERDGVVPLVPRDGSGRSFPSRHAFSAFAIASCWWALCPAVAVALLVCACLLAVLRVFAGVHYPRDVIAGAFCGTVAGLCAAGLAVLLAC